MPATSKQSLIVTGKPTRGRATPRALPRIRTGRGAPGRSGIFLHNRVQGPFEVLDGGKSRKCRK
jgi:hypothetical protein